MSEIGERAEKIWREQTEIIRRKKELRSQVKDCTNLILDVFGASNELYYVSTVAVYYDYNKCLVVCGAQLCDNNTDETDYTIHESVEDEKIMAAMNNVNACQISDCGINARIYNLLASDPQVTKYFEVTLYKDCGMMIIIKRRPEKDVTLD